MQLPQRPHLRHLSNQAKALCKAHRDGDAEVAERLKAELPRFAACSTAAILAADLSLQEAQHVLAKEYGFAHWKELGEYVKAHEIPAGSIFVHDPDDWLEKVQNEEFHRSVDAHETNKGIIRRKVDRAGHRKDYQVQYRETISVPEWNTPQEREEGHRLRVTHHFSAQQRDFERRDENEKPRDKYETSKGDIVREVHGDFSARIADTLSRVTQTETNVGLFDAGNRQYADVVETVRNKDVLVYRFAMDPGGLALMTVGVPSMCSFIAKPYKGKEQDAEWSAEDRHQALDVVDHLLADLQRSWANQRRMQFGDIALYENECRVLDLGFEEQLAHAEVFVQSNWASRSLNLYYPETTLRKVLAHLVGV